MASNSAQRDEEVLGTLRSITNTFFNEPFFMSNREVNGRYRPRVEIADEENVYVIRAQLRDMSREDIAIVVEGRVLSIYDKARENKNHDGRAERRGHYFHRCFTLPAYVDTNQVEAVYEGCVLELRMRKLGECKEPPKIIEIKS